MIRLYNITKLQGHEQLYFQTRDTIIQTSPDQNTKLLHKHEQLYSQTRIIQSLPLSLYEALTRVRATLFSNLAYKP